MTRELTDDEMAALIDALCILGPDRDPVTDDDVAEVLGLAERISRGEDRDDE